MLNFCCGLPFPQHLAHNLSILEPTQPTKQVTFSAVILAAYGCLLAVSDL
jgi:hypothetical protein